jgi:hypothetical protein
MIGETPGEPDARPGRRGDEPADSGISAEPLLPLLELGVAEAYILARDRFVLTDLPPLEAIENEDWGRDYLLSRLATLPDSALLSAGLTRSDRPPV